MANGREPARKPQREEARSGLRDDEFIGRNGEVIRFRTDLTDTNPYDVPSNLIEKDWSYQWVRKTCHGQTDTNNLIARADRGWRPVDADSHGGGFRKFFQTPKDEKEICRDGLVLMERPAYITEQFKIEDERKAALQRVDQVAEFALSDLPAGFKADYNKAKTRHNISGNVKREAYQVPPDSYPKRELAVGDE